MKEPLFFRPALLDSLKGYTPKLLANDLMAGLIVGIVALPLAIAFGIASGVSPEKGLITAIIGGFLVSALGGSKVQIGGPTGAFIIIVYGIIQQHGIEGLAISTVLAGGILLLLGLLRLGSVIRFIPYPIIVGFTSGIAVTIFSTQIKDLLGLSLEALPGDFLGKWRAYIEGIGTLDLFTTGIGLLTILLVALFPRISKKVPGSLVAIIVMTLAVLLLRQRMGIETIETIGDRFTFSSSLPKFSFFSISMSQVRELLPSAFTIAMLGAIESLLSASVADGVIGTKHDSNTELIAQGVANTLVPFFGGIPVTGAIARTMTNINNGGRSPIAGIIHAITLLLIVIFLGSLTAYIPMACLAGILVIVSYNMSEWRSFKAILRGPKSDVAVLLVTFFLTVIFDLTIAIEIGLLLTMLLFTRRIYQASQISRYTQRVGIDSELSGSGDDTLDLPNQVEVYEIQGPFFFGIANKFDEVTKTIGEKPKVRILRMRRVPFIDATGARNLKMMIIRSKKEGIHILLSGVRPELLATLQQVGIEKELGLENIYPHIQLAVAKANELVNAR